MNLMNHAVQIYPKFQRAWDTNYQKINLINSVPEASEDTYIFQCCELEL